MGREPAGRLLSHALCISPLDQYSDAGASSVPAIPVLPLQAAFSEGSFLAAHQRSQEVVHHDHPLPLQPSATNQTAEAIDLPLVEFSPDQGGSSSAAPSGRKRSDGPVVLSYCRGSRKAAREIARDPEKLDKSIKTLKNRIFSNSSTGTRDSRLETWDTIATDAGLDPSHFTADLVYTVVAVLHLRSADFAVHRRPF